jgi:hypothetical protein
MHQPDKCIHMSKVGILVRGLSCGVKTVQFVGNRWQRSIPQRRSLALAHAVNISGRASFLSLQPSPSEPLWGTAEAFKTGYFFVARTLGRTLACLVYLAPLGLLVRCGAKLQQLLLPPLPRANKYPLRRFFIVNDVLSRPYRAKFSYTFFCTVAGLHGLDKMEVSIPLQFENAEQ